MTLYIYTPKVLGRSVNFRFSCDEIVPDVTSFDFQVDYECDISSLPVAVHYNTALAYILAPVSTYEHLNGHGLNIVLEDAQTKSLVEFWTEYHGLKHSTVSPVSNSDMAPVSKKKSNVAKPIFGILFGGGKDSMFTLSLLRAIYPADQVKLISFNIPTTLNIKSALEDRRDRLSLDNAKRIFDVEVIKVSTSARASMGTHLHTELYAGPLLPVLMANDITHVTFSYEYPHYFTRTQEGPQVHFRRSRDEMNEALSQVYTKILGSSFTFFNANRFVTEVSAFEYLVSSMKPEDLSQSLMMCEASVEDARWCLNCHKCAQCALYSLLFNINFDQLDVSAFFENSPWIGRMLSQIGSRGLEGPDAPPMKRRYFPGLCANLHYDSFRATLSRLSKQPQKSLSESAQANLDRLVKVFAEEGDGSDFSYFVNALKESWPHEMTARVDAELKGRVDRRAEAPLEKAYGEIRTFFEPLSKPLLSKPPIRPTITVYQDFVAEQIARSPLWSDRRRRTVRGETWSATPEGNITEAEMVVEANIADVSASITRSDLRKHSGFALINNLSDPSGKGTFMIGMTILSPFRGDLSGYLHYELLLDNQLLLSCDLASKQVENTIAIHGVTMDRPRDIKIRMRATKDCPAWGFGRASRLILRDVFISLTDESNGLTAQFTNPASISHYP
jgi:hypothetical protein